MKYYISGYIWDSWQADFLSWQLDNQNPSELELYFDSHGGDPVAAGAIAEVIRKFEGKKTAYAIGYLQSAAVIPFLAVEKENRYIAKTSEVLLHRLRTTALSMTAEELMQAADEAVRYEYQMVELHARELGKTTAEVESIMRAERRLTAAEAVEMGLAAGIIGEASDPAKMAGMTMCALSAAETAETAETAEAAEAAETAEADKKMQSVLMLAKYADDAVIGQYASGQISIDGFVLAVAKDIAKRVSVDIPRVDAEFFGGGETGVNGKRQKYVDDYNNDQHIRSLFRHGAEKYADYMMSRGKKR